MSSKKKDLEIIFNLQWKYGPKVAERSNIVGVYDLPSTTLNWEPFKSYILKNSGTPGDDVKVSYIEDGREFPIESTLDFQSALYAFRKKAMNGEIINLKLERLSNVNKSIRLSPTCDAQTECNYDFKMDRAPEWFTSYMAEFKKDILNEVASAVTANAAILKPSVSHSHYPRKSKTECGKRCRKNYHPDGNEKEVLKTTKLEKKLESKMEKLVNKSKKLKEKKVLLLTKSSDSDAGHSSSKSNSETISTVDISKMSAAPVRFDETIIPHLMGGEVYRHCWKVINNGLSPWTEDTELHFSWGSSLLEPIQRVIACPPLKPGEIGSIEALIHVPKICGRYQMYWHFHHKGRKFGHWLGCEIIVDKVNSTEQLSTSFLRSFTSKNDISDHLTKIGSEFKTPHDSVVDNKNILTADEQTEKDTNASVPVLMDEIKDLHISENASSTSTKQSLEIFSQEIEEVIINKSPSKIQIIEEYFTNIDETKPIWNLNGINYSTDSIQKNSDDENINARGDEDSHSESISKIDEETSSNHSILNDMVMINFPDEIEQPIRGYAYVEIDGIKTAVPKKYLRVDYLETAEDAPDPYESNMRDFLDLKISTYNPTDDIGDYGDIPDLVPSDYEDYTPNLLNRNSILENENEIPNSRICLLEHFADYEIIKENVHRTGAKLDSEVGQNHKNKDGYGANEQPENSSYQLLFDSVPSQQIPQEVGQNHKNKDGYGANEQPENSSYQLLCDSVPSQQIPQEVEQNHKNKDGYGANEQPENSSNQLLFDSVPPQPIPQGEKITLTNTAPSEYLGTSNIYPAIDYNHFLPHIPNYQQTPSEFRPQLISNVQECSKEFGRSTYFAKPEMVNVITGNEVNPISREDKSPNKISPSSSFGESDRQRTVPDASAPIASVVSEAMTMASSALKTVVNKIIPSKNEEELGVWINGHWVPTAENTIRENNLKILSDMGFKNRDLNASLLARYDDDVRRVVTELVQ